MGNTHPRGNSPYLEMKRACGKSVFKSLFGFRSSYGYFTLRGKKVKNKRSGGAKEGRVVKKIHSDS